jgi:tRNA (Thr-GGU) A37 N-methylase
MLSGHPRAFRHVAVLDGTPLLDLKPVLSADARRR